jgi:hypothetical protein
MRDDRAHSNFIDAPSDIPRLANFSLLKHYKTNYQQISCRTGLKRYSCGKAGYCASDCTVPKVQDVEQDVEQEVESLVAEEDKRNHAE